MKIVYFKMLDFEAKIQNNDVYADLGTVPDIFEKTQELYREYGLSEEEIRKKLTTFVAKLKTTWKNIGGMQVQFENWPLNKSKSSYIFYRDFGDPSIDFPIIAHEEAHAICHFGLRSQLEKKIGNSFPLSRLPEEKFCDQAGRYALQRAGIK